MGGGRGATFTIDGVSKVSTADFTDLNWEGFEEGDTHVVFEDVLPVNGEIVVTIKNENGSDNNGFFSGFQVGVYPPPPGGAVFIIR